MLVISAAYLYRKLRVKTNNACRVIVGELGWPHNSVASKPHPQTLGRDFLQLGIHHYFR